MNTPFNIKHKIQDPIYKDTGNLIWGAVGDNVYKASLSRAQGLVLSRVSNRCNHVNFIKYAVEAQLDEYKF